MSDYTIDEASRLSGITVRSLRNYVHHYADFLNLKRGPYNSLIFDDDDLQTLVKVKSLLRDGKTRQEICEILSKEREDPKIQVRPNSLQTSEKPVLLPILKKIDGVLTELLEENRKLHLRLEEVEEELERNRQISISNQIGSTSSYKSKSASSASAIEFPYFLLAAKDGCKALALSFWSTFFGKND
mgnify:CR=1 FL=1